MGRPRKSDQTIVVSANGQGVVWDAAVGFVGDAPLTQRAKTAALWAMEVQIHPLLPTVTAGSTDPVAAYAALSWASGGRGVIVSAPVEVYALFASVDGDEEDLCPDDQIEFEPELFMAEEA